MQTYLVTGGAGFIGSNIVQALVEKGNRVRVLDNFSTGRESFLKPFRRDVQIQRGDISVFSDCQKAVQGMDVILHQAAMTSVAKSVRNPIMAHQTDATGTLYLLEAARQKSVKRFVYASSSAVYGEPARLPVREDDLARPLSPYGVAKLAAEHYVYAYHANYGMETVSLRYFNVYGPHQNPESQYSAAVPGILDRLQKNQRPVIYGDGKQKRDFVYVRDVVSANLLAAERPAAAGKVFNVGSGEEVSILELCRMLTGLLKKETLAPVFQKARPSDPRRTLGDTRAARRILGWKPATEFEKGLEETVAWILDGGLAS